MKKLIILMMVMVILAAATACGMPANAPDAVEPATPVQESDASTVANEETEGKKIGVIFYSKDDALGQAVYATLNHAAEALNIELAWKLGDVDPTAQITSAENLVAAGCDGILCIPISEVVTQKVAQLCEENGVYYANCFRNVTDEEIRAQIDTYEYYVGSCYEDETAATENLVKIMAEAGKKNCVVNYVSPSSALALRNVGCDAGIEKYGMNKLAEYTLPDSPDLNTIASTVQNYLNAYSDLDVILAMSASVGQGETIVNTLKSLAPNGEVQLACFDVFEGMKQAFADGTLACAVGGMSPDALFSFIMLYNAVNGTPLSDQPEYLTQNYIFVTSEEECEGYEKYIDNPEYMIYTAEDIQAMSRANDPDFDIEDLRGIMAEYTMANVMEKAEG